MFAFYLTRVNYAIPYLQFPEKGRQTFPLRIKEIVLIAEVQIIAQPFLIRPMRFFRNRLIPQTFLKLYRSQITLRMAARHFLGKLQLCNISKIIF